MNPSTAAAGTIVEALTSLGVTDVVLCPGSRSAPLAYALAGAAEAGDLRLHVRLDERSAGFVALGTALASGTPAAVVVTSGTAVANLHPAVLEADAAGVPLIVISADRPHELRGIGANQVTDQVGIFGSALRRFVEIPAADGVTPAQVAGWRQQVSRVVAAARGGIGGDPGPVQLNVAFRDPLVPDGGGVPLADGGGVPLADDGVAGVGAAVPAGLAGLTRTEQVVTEAVPVRLPAGPRTVVLAGHGAGATPLVVARAAGWPLLAEPSSGARMEDAIPPYRLLLDTPELGGRVQRVLLYGRPTLNRQVTRLLARPDVEVIVVSTRPDWADPSGRAARVVPAVDPPLAGTGPELIDGERPGDWLDAWIAAGEAVTKAVDDVLGAELAAGRLTGPLVAREVAAATLAGDVLVAGSSNAIRDLDLTALALPGAVRWIAGRKVKVEGAGRILANRGLAGIDGTVSTAIGVAQQVSLAGQVSPNGPGRTRVLLGDLTLLHDTGGLLHGMLESPPQVQIVVLDDGGGAIFGTLEHGTRALAGATEKALFERLFSTPQVFDLAALCAGLGVTHELVDDIARLREALATPSAGLSVLQIRLDRSGQRDLNTRITEAATTSLS